MANTKILPHVAMSMYEDELDFILSANVYDEQVARRIAMEVDECYRQYEQEKVERIVRETELCWDAYNESRRILFEVDECYKQYACEEAELIAFETEISWLEYEISKSQEEEVEDDVPVDVYLDMFLELKDEASAKSVQKPSKPQRTGVYRCKQEVHHRNKLRRNAIDTMKNMNKRICEDLNNMTASNRLFVIDEMSNGIPLRKYADIITYCKSRGGHPVQLPKSLTIKAEKVWARAAKMELV